MDITSPDEPQLAPSLDGAAALLPASDTLPELDVRFGYRIGGFAFVLDKSLLTEIVVRPTIYTLPHSPSWFCGVINLRGNIIPVLDLSSALNTISHDVVGEYVLVVDRGRDALGLIVDAPPQTLNNPQPLFSTPPLSGAPTDFIQDGVQAADTRWQQLDVKGLALNLGAST